MTSKNQQLHTYLDIEVTYIYSYIHTLLIGLHTNDVNTYTPTHIPIYRSDLYILLYSHITHNPLYK